MLSILTGYILRAVSAGRLLGLPLTKLKTERCNRILLSAMKQSLKFHLPKLNEAIILKDFLKQYFEGHKYIAHCEDGEKIELNLYRLM